jgi:hypothetical protein
VEDIDLRKIKPSVKAETRVKKSAGSIPVPSSGFLGDLPDR